MKRFAHNLIAVCLVLTLGCVDTFAAATAGMLRSSGGVSVNGSAVTPLTTVFAGDRIETAPKAVGSLTVDRSSLLLGENSSVVFRGQGLDFYCGGGTIQTDQAMSARYGRIEVRPAKDSARYQVQQMGAMLRVSALEGDLTLTEGAKNYSLPAGNSMNLPYTGCVQQVAKNETPNAMGNGDPAANPVASQPAPTPVPEPAPVNTTAMIVTPAAVASVALTGIIAVVKNPVSPHSP